MRDLHDEVEKPLRGITVLDLTHALSGPYATLLLAGLGAQVIKVEHPGGGDLARNNAPYMGAEGLKLARTGDNDISVPFLNRCRDKLSVTLDLKRPRGREVFGDLVKVSDLIVENFSAGTADRLGIGYDVARKHNRRIVYCSVSGFGMGGGPAKAMDVIIQAASGMMMASGAMDAAPVRVGLPIADLSAALFAVIGSTAALLQAQRTGEGQHVDVSMLGALTSLIACEDFDAMASLGLPFRTGNSLPRLAPFGVFSTQDGYVAICAPSDEFADRLFRAMSRPELLNDRRFDTRDRRVEHATELDDLIAKWTSTRSTEETLAALQDVGVPTTAVRTPSESVRDAAADLRSEVVPLEHPAFGQTAEVYGTGFPVRFSATDAQYRRPAPALGEHNDSVYEKLLGYSPDAIKQLQRDGTI